MHIENILKISNKNRLSLMIVLIISSILYQMKLLEISDSTNYAFTLSALLFSVSSCLDTYASYNLKEEVFRFIIDTIALAITIMLPNLKDEGFLILIKSHLDPNLLLILALFFMLASQWAAEVKIRDIRNKREEK